MAEERAGAGQVGWLFLFFAACFSLRFEWLVVFALFFGTGDQLSD